MQKQPLQKRWWSGTILLFLSGLGIALAACGTPAPKPTAGAKAQDVYEVTSATALAQSGPSAGNVQPGNASRGAQVFQGVGTCSTCHDTTLGATITGPSLKGLASRAGQRKPPMSADEYIRESIMKPNAFVVQNFQPNIMPQNFSQALNAQQLEDIVAFLLSLK